MQNIKFCCICFDVYKIYEGGDFDKVYDVLSTLKHKKVKTNNILIDKYKDMLENQDFDQKIIGQEQQKVFKKKVLTLLDWWNGYAIMIDPIMKILIDMI